MYSTLCLTLPSFLVSLSLLPLSVSSSSVAVDHSILDLLDAALLPEPHPNVEVSLYRQLVGSGYHRTLLTRVERVISPQSMQDAPDPSVLSVAIVENITCDMYVDVDQVRNLPNYMYPRHVQFHLYSHLEETQR